MAIASTGLNEKTLKRLKMPYENASNLDKVKRLYRNVSVMCNVIRSLQLIDVYMMHSVIDLYNCIEKLAKASLKESNKRIEDDEA